MITNSYYTRREPQGEMDFAGYWGEVVDPDGTRRNRSEEREQYLSDVSQELRFLECLRPGATVSVLDVGGGPGWMLSALPERFQKTLVELSPDACQMALDAGLDDVRQCDLRDCDFAPESFDAVVCHHVIEHVPDPVPMVAEMHRVLSKGGWLVLGTPDFDSPCARRFGDNYRMLHDPTHVSLFSLESMYRLLCDVGFRVSSVTFPFPGRYDTKETRKRWKDTSKVSPPWPGSWMTFYASKP